MGFETTTGSYDCLYRWPSRATVEDAIFLADKVHATLKGMGVHFKMETVSDGL